MGPWLDDWMPSAEQREASGSQPARRGGQAKRASTAIPVHEYPKTGTRTCKHSAHVALFRWRGYIRCITLHRVHHQMATQKPRITISLDQDVYDTIRGLSDAQGCTMSGLVSEFLSTVNPVQQRVLQAVKKAQSLNVESKASMVSSLEASEAQLTEMLGPLLALMDRVGEGQPPHGNTGVTNTNLSGDGNKKTASKARPRAVQPDMFDTKTQKPKNTKTQARKSTKAPAYGA